MKHQRYQLTNRVPRMIAKVPDNDVVLNCSIVVRWCHLKDFDLKGLVHILLLIHVKTI